eukprot:COSAG05_NODE_165_length_15343_cov_194.625492_8_plen_159_part_00
MWVQGFRVPAPIKPVCSVRSSIVPRISGLAISGQRLAVYTVEKRQNGAHTCSTATVESSSCGVSARTFAVLYPLPIVWPKPDRMPIVNWRARRLPSGVSTQANPWGGHAQAGQWSVHSFHPEDKDVTDCRCGHTHVTQAIVSGQRRNHICAVVVARIK